MLSGRGIFTLLVPAGHSNERHQIEARPHRTRRHIFLALVSSAYFSNALSCYLTKG
jgi:hypothetical protein